MKKIITLCVFAFALVLGTQTMNGQTMVEINQAAFTKTQELKKIIKFDAETEEEVYLVYQALFLLELLLLIALIHTIA